MTKKPLKYIYKNVLIYFSLFQISEEVAGPDSRRWRTTWSRSWSCRTSPEECPNFVKNNNGFRRNRSAKSTRDFSKSSPWKTFWKRYFRTRVNLKTVQSSQKSCHVSMSSTLYARVFRWNVISAAFFLVTCTLRIHGKSCWNGIRTKNSYVKCWWNWHMVGITITLLLAYKQTPCLGWTFKVYKLTSKNILYI